MNILVLNCGSSSIKYQLIDMTNEPIVMAKGLVERIGIPNSELTHKPEGKDKFNIVQDIPNHEVGINLILDALVNPVHGVINNEKEIHAVGHRVAHGGENFKQSVLVDNSVLIDIEKCIELAPLHNPANLKGITSMEKILPGVKQVAVFDTSFHQTMPAYSYMYAIPHEFYDKYKVRRYGFHGTSYRFVVEKAGALVGKNWEDLKIVACHLGNGASIAAINKGKCVDTSMGFTPVEGLIMGTRTGDLDLGVLLFLMEKEGLDSKKANNFINKECGMQGISGISSDMRDLWSAAESGNEKAKLALNMFAYRVRKYIGAYAAAMNGVDVILFTGGIGENDCQLRNMICTELTYLGVDFNSELNNGLRGKDMILTKPNSKTIAMTVTTNEEAVIAADTKHIVYGA
ncbi:MAG: acetate kinase [Bacteroidota bacterium]